MPLNITPLSPVFGASIDGLDTSKPASKEEAAEIRALLAKHKLVVIKGSRLTASQVGSFGRSLGLGPTKEFGAKHLNNTNLTSTSDAAVTSLAYGPDLPKANINLYACRVWNPGLAPPIPLLISPAFEPLRGQVASGPHVARLSDPLRTLLC